MKDLTTHHRDRVFIPEVDGDWWNITGIPDLGMYNKENQQPMDFDVWRAADDTWQLVACCRNTGCGGNGRLFYRWQSDSIEDHSWQPMGIFMEAEPNFGETVGGLQSPCVIEHEGEYFMFYGDWKHICMAWSSDGKTFARLIHDDGTSGIFKEGLGSGTRDPHVMKSNDQFYIYYTGIDSEQSAIYCRTSNDLRTWGESIIVNRGGSGGSGTSDAECPCVIFQKKENMYYLFRAYTLENTDQYETSIYRSPDPLNFGIDSDEFKVASLPVEAVRIIKSDGQFYIFALKPDLTGMMMAKLKWVQTQRSDAR